MKRLLLSALLVALFAREGLAGERFEPGLWRSTATVEGRGSQTTGPRCVTTEEGRSMNGSADSIRTALASDPAWRGCEIRDVRAEGAAVDFVAACTGETVTTSRTIYAGTSYEGTIRVTVAGSPAMTMTVKGERTGACP